MTEKRAMLIWRIGKIATSSVTVEEADTWEQACRKAGWEPEDCEVADITESVRVLVEGGQGRPDILGRELWLTARSPRW